MGESAATAVVDRLVRQGLVVRRDDPSDRRVVRLALSDTGESLVTKLHATACRKTANLLVSLSDDQLAQLVATMEMLDAAASASEALGDLERRCASQHRGGASTMTTTDRILGADQGAAALQGGPPPRRRTRSARAE